MPTRGHLSVNAERIGADLGLPLVIAVTGHRDIRNEDIPHLKKCVREIFDGLHQKYPASSLLAMSPLAEGADRLVAQVALEDRPDGNRRALLFVPLPLPIALYERDFESTNSKEEFRYLLSQSTRHFELPLVGDNTEESVSDYGSARDKQYAQVGAYLARHSHILIALWDGEETGKEGGTSQVVAFKLSGIGLPYATPRRPLDLVDNGPVYHIRTPRRTTVQFANPYALDIRFPEEWETLEPFEVAYNRILQQMDTFNSDAQRIIPQRQEEVDRNKDYVIPESQKSRLGFEARFILNKYALADTLALYFQRYRRRAPISLFMFAVTAVLSFEVYAHLLINPIVLGLYPISLAAAVMVYWLAKKVDAQNKHLNYRALAEGLRVQLFWTLAGLSDEVADHYLRQHRTELDWIRNAIRAWNALAGHLSLTDKLPLENIQARFDLNFRNWIDDQWRFFGDATYRDRENFRADSKS